MDARPKKQSAVDRLLGFLSQAPHDYRPATTIFVDLDAERLARDLQLGALGQERGAADRPPSNAQPFDDVEHKIIDRIEKHKNDSHEIYLSHLHTYHDRLAALDFEGRFTVIQQAAPEAVGDFRAEAALGRDELFSLRRQLYEAEKERDRFRQKHKIDRPARISTRAGTLFKISLLAILFLIEVVINGSFLAPTNIGGILGGAVQAVSFAALNIAASFFWGLVLIRLINRRNLFLKLVGVISFIAYLAFAIFLNLTLAHLREIPPSAAADVGQQVLARLISAPYVLNDVNSWVFFGIGFIFSLIAMADGLLFTDPYPGYGSLEKRCMAAHSRYKDGKEDLIGRLRDIRNAAADAMDNAGRDLSVRRGEYDAILQGWSRLAQSFGQHQNQIERTSQSLIARYREANERARKAAPPEYFAKPYNMERIVAHAHQPDERERERLRQSIAETQSLLQKQITAVHECFEQAVRTYHEIDDLIPEQRP